MAGASVMDHKRLAFDLLKIVVAARDGGRAADPQVATVWAMIRAELPPAHRVISDEVAWRRDQQSDLKFVIDALAGVLAAENDLSSELDRLLELKREAATQTNHGGASGPEREATSAGSVPSPRVLSTVPQLHPQPPAHTRAAPAARGVAPSGGINSRLQKAAAISPAARSRLVAAVLVLSGILLLTAVYVRWSGSAPASPPTATTAVNVPPEAKLERPTVLREELPVRRAAPRSVASDGDAAHLEQRREVARLEAEGAPPAVRSEAYVALASLSADRGRYREAVEAQREGLELAYDAGLNDELALGRHHLSLGRYYHQTGQKVIARAHLRQARHFSGRAGDAIAAAEIAEEVTEVERVYGGKS